MIVVGGLQRLSETSDDVELWPSSSFSPMLVDIAAPADDILSFDMNGKPLCMSGTSAAAPQVSFAAGVLRALGYWSNGETKRRILATADYSDDLKDKVRGGRKFNVANALDVFVDLICWPAA